MSNPYYPDDCPSPDFDSEPAKPRSLERLVGAIRSASKKHLSYCKKVAAAGDGELSLHNLWNDKQAKYWEGRRDGLQQALNSIGPNTQIGNAAGKETQP